MSSRMALVVGACLAAAGVALGALGAHGLDDRLLALGYEADLPKRLEWFETGVRYQLLHGLALVAVARLPKSGAACVAFLCGVLLFSGSLYGLATLPADWRRLGAVVPLGGVALIVGWTLVAIGAWRSEAA